MTTAPLPQAIKLRPYQDEGLEAVNRELDAGRSTLVHWATGLGKTILIAGVIRDRGGRVLLMAHRKELLDQAVKRIQSVIPGAEVGRIQGKHHQDGHPIVVASVQTLVRRLGRLKPYDLLVIDEAHHAAAGTYRQVIARLRELNPDCGLLGVTATPRRSDDQGLVGPERIFDSVAHRADLRWAIEAGWLCPLRGKVVHTEFDVNLEFRRGDFTPKSLSLLNTPERNRIIVDHWKTEAEGCQTLAFTSSVDHATQLAEEFESAGFAAGVVTGKTAKDIRAELLESYSTGKVQIVCNCQVLTEGFDAPQTACILLARPISKKALGLYAQIIGRGTRPAPGKDDCLILDFADNIKGHKLAKLSDLGIGKDEKEAQEAKDPSEETEDTRADLKPRQPSLLDSWIEDVDPFYGPPPAYNLGLVHIDDANVSDLALSLENKTGTIIVSEGTFRGRPLWDVWWSHNRKHERVVRLLELGALVDVLRDLGCEYEHSARWRRLPLSPAQQALIEKLSIKLWGVPYWSTPTLMGNASALIGYLFWRLR